MSNITITRIDEDKYVFERFEPKLGEPYSQTYYRIVEGETEEDFLHQALMNFNSAFKRWSTRPEEMKIGETKRVPAPLDLDESELDYIEKLKEPGFWRTLFS